jgi:hypothetical protein
MREFLSTRADETLIKLAIRDIRAGKVLRPALKATIERLEALLADLPRLSGMLTSRRKGFGHVFGAGLEAARKDPQRAAYLRMCDELRELARTPEFRQLLKLKGPRGKIDKHARDSMQNLSGVVERYGDLYRETYTLNALTRRLYPGRTTIGFTKSGVPIKGPKEYLSLRLDAQHIVEQRAFAKKEWGKDWALLGWKSTNDMPAIPVMHEWHIRSPKNLMGMDDVYLDAAEKPIQDVFSLTDEMEKALKLDKFAKPEDYLRALSTFYDVAAKNRRGVDVQPLRDLVKFADEVREQLRRARAQSEGAAFKAVKNLRGE